MSTWAERARAYIAKVTADLPADADLATRRKLLRRHAGNFHGGTSWGKKVWSREARRYLERYGLPLKDGDQERLFADDIAFPWKGESDG